MSKYSELLKDPRWQRKRLEILNRDAFTCRECLRSDRTLHVHHRRYIKNRAPWEYDGDDLVTLCDVCHERVTVLTKRIAEEIGRLRSWQLEEILGIAVASRESWTRGESTFAIEGAGFARGLARMFEVPWSAIVRRFGENGTTTAGDLIDLSLRHHESPMCFHCGQQGCAGSGASQARCPEQQASMRELDALFAQAGWKAQVPS